MIGSAGAISIARTSWLLALRDLQAQRARSILAPLWPGVAPVGQALIIFAVARTVLGPRTPHYFSFLILGCLSWAHLSGCISAALPSIVDGGAAVRRGGLPLLALPLGAVVRVSASLAPYLLAAVLFANIDSADVHPGWLLLALLAQLVSVACVATAFAIGHVFIRGLRYGADLALQVGFYATPVILPLQHYPDSLRGIVRWLPSTALVEVWRRAGTGVGAVSEGAVVMVVLVLASVGLIWRSRPAVMRASTW